MAEPDKFPTKRHGPDTVRRGVKIRAGGLNKLVLSDKGTLSNPRWTDRDSGEVLETARTGRTLKMLVDVEGFRFTKKASFEIFEYDVDSEDDPVATVEGKVENGQAWADWDYVYTDDEDEEGTDNKYTKPEYYFLCKVVKEECKSELLNFEDFVEIEVKSSKGRPVQNIDFCLIQPDGEERWGVVDEKGYAKVEEVPPGQYKIHFVRRAFATPPLFKQKEDGVDIHQLKEVKEQLG